MKKIIRVFLCLLTAAAAAIIADIIRKLTGAPFSWIIPAAAFTAVFTLLCVFVRSARNAVICFVSVPLLAAAVWFGSLGIVRLAAPLSVSRNADNGKSALYAEKNVMILVPHEDDEINLAGGVTEEYLRYGSTVTWVFYTNGDAFIDAETRYREALASAACYGIPGNRVIFLGYGDQWAEDEHIYHSAVGKTLTSMAGFTSVYGTSVHPAYHEGKPYQRESILEDLADLVLELRPDVILCNDYDAHIDHRALSLFFDRAMGSVLKKEPDYRPIIYKGFAYSTGWTAKPDFYDDLNLLSTKKPSSAKKNVMGETGIYHWKERTRFPVGDTSVSRLIRGSRTWQALACHASQDAETQAERVINGDRIFWRRYTGSLCLNASVRVSSGDGTLLNDFMLSDSDDISVNKQKPLRGVWFPEAGDEDREAEFSFPAPVHTGWITLYDSPDPDANVTSALIILSDGTEIVVNADEIDPWGGASWIPVDRETSAFTVRILDREGDRAGFTEIEAYDAKPEDEAFIKLTDSDDNFLYDWIPQEDGPYTLSLYRNGSLPALSPDDYEISADDTAGSVSIEKGKLVVNCPKGHAIRIRVTLKGTDIADTVTVSRKLQFWSALRQIEIFHSRSMEAHWERYLEDHPFLVTEEEEEL